MSPRQILGSGETPVLHPLGAHVTIGLSRGMNNPGREANALGNSKTQLIPAPTIEQLSRYNSRYPTQAAPVEARDVGAQLQLQAPSTPVSAPKRLAPIADSHPESVFGEKDPARFFEAIMPPSPAVPAPEDSKPAESDMSPIQGMPWFSPAPSIHSPAPPSPLPPSPPQAQPTQVPVGVSKSEQLPFKVPAGGDYIQLKNWDGEWETWLVQAPNVSATDPLSDPLIRVRAVNRGAPGCLRQWP